MILKNFFQKTVHVFSFLVLAVCIGALPGWGMPGTDEDLEKTISSLTLRKEKIEEKLLKVQQGRLEPKEMLDTRKQRTRGEYKKRRYQKSSKENRKHIVNNKTKQYNDLLEQIEEDIVKTQNLYRDKKIQELLLLESYVPQITSRLTKVQAYRDKVGGDLFRFKAFIAKRETIMDTLVDNLRKAFTAYKQNYPQEESFSQVLQKNMQPFYDGRELSLEDEAKMREIFEKTVQTFEKKLESSEELNKLVNVLESTKEQLEDEEEDKVTLDLIESTIHDLRREEETLRTYEQNLNTQIFALRKKIEDLTPKTDNKSK